jgi:hypothetical protein
MSRSGGGNYDPDGIYMTYTDSLDSPRPGRSRSSSSRRIKAGIPRLWCDQSIQGTDKLAGSVARYFNMGRSTFLISFRRSTDATSSASGTLHPRRVPTGTR